MFSFRDLIVFLAGAEFFHTFSHIIIAYFIDLPLNTKFMILTPTINVWAVIINAVITVVLLWWAYKLKR